MSVDNNQTSKAFPYSSFIPFYFNGLAISNDATTPNTLLDVAPGSCLDSTGTFQMTLPAAVKINSASNGLNGLDTGTIAASTMYAVYLVSDPVTQQPTGAMISLAYGTKSPATPLLPFGYSAYALIGFVTVSSGSAFVKGYWSDNDSARRVFTYDAFQATAVTAGASTSYANVDLTKFVPLINNLQVQVYTNFNANAAADILSLQAGNGTGDQAIIIAQVAGSTAHLASIDNILAQTIAISTVPSPTINYKVSAGAVAVDVAGYTFDL